LFLNPESETKSLLSFNQLKNAVRLSIDRKDKLSISGNKIIVLLIKDDVDNLYIMSRIKSNLPFDNPDDLDKILEYISINYVVVDDTINSVADILKKLSIEIEELS
jgi:hypothetical protein